MSRMHKGVAVATPNDIDRMVAVGVMELSPYGDEPDQWVSADGRTCFVGWSPSGFMPEAWHVVHKVIRDTGRGFNLSFKDGRWRCSFIGDGKVGHATAPTAERAICLASLDAVGYDRMRRAQ
jgi:hypothetical protein